MLKIVVALFALVAVSQAVLPYGIYGANPISVDISGLGYAASPYAVPYAAPYAVHSPVVAAVPHGASYVAANRGSVHSAPLPGHIVGSQQLNLSPAPGTY